MAVDAYLIISGQPGPSTSPQGTAADVLSYSAGASQPATTGVTQPATVQLGEQTLGQVAGRLGVDPNLLQQANPHITDPANLKVGQEIQLPNPAPRSETSSETEGPHHHHHHQESQNPPLGSSIEASLMKAKLDGMTAKKQDD